MGWQFFIDRGGTFTDVVAHDPEGRRHVRKVLSDDWRHGDEAALEAMRAAAGTDDLAGVAATVRMGTTVATNALLERKGVPTCLAVTRGFGDALRIGFQDRPELFDLEIRKPEPLHAHVVEVDERVLADGTVRRPLDEPAVREGLAAALASGCRALAVVLVHGYLHPEHERAVARIGREVGFEHVSASHAVAPEPGLVARGDTTCVDAYLTPLLQRHVEGLRSRLSPGVELRLMQSQGTLSADEGFSGKDAILSGPAGGVVALASVAAAAGFDQAIGFDMGGTSTDVSRWSAAEGPERVHERTVAGIRLRTPMVDVVTVAAGGGSVLASDGRRLTVGPESAGADPGPACYRAGGPAAVTDANAVLGRIQPEWFPRCFGASGDQPIDVAASRARLEELGRTVDLLPDEAAAGFVRIADANMAAAIRKISVARGRDVREHVLVCFGGAAGQHACSVSDALGIRAVLLHPLAGVLSAHGMALADVGRSTVLPVLAPLEPGLLADLDERLAARERSERAALVGGGVPPARVRSRVSVDLRYAGVEHALEVPAQRPLSREALLAGFEAEHRRLFGFAEPGQDVEVVAARLEVLGSLDRPPERVLPPARGPARPVARRPVAFDRPGDGGSRALEWVETPVHVRADLKPGHVLVGPALVAEDVSTILVEPGWACRVLHDGSLLLERETAREGEREIGPSRRDPVRLEIFSNLFMSVAEQMGETLRRVSRSTNIKERLDYSCAVFTRDGRLVANAPHVPVHLGAMGETVRSILAARAGRLEPGQSVASNDPYHGGSHLPDVTVVSPVHVGSELAFLVANRGHHADVGGVVPGSMPPASADIAEEGVVLHDLTLVQAGRFREADVARALTSGPHPVRDVAERLSDLRAQVAANAVGRRLLDELCARHGLGVVQAYAGHVLDDAAAAAREVLAGLPQGEHRFEDGLDEGARIAVTVTIGGGRAVFDFAGTSAQLAGNLNAPRAVTRAAVLYVVRCLIGRPIPLNDGCLEPMEIRIPEGSLLDPSPPAAVAGGNVETSMRIADVLLGALGVLAAGQGTMNNVTFGDSRYGYYETICGGAGAGRGFDGASAVHVHLTNTRITDVEVLERRHPVLLRAFAVRRGSGGRGRWSGGEGVVREIEFLAPATVAVLSERRVSAPFGLAGGGPGARGRNRILRADGSSEDLGGKGQARVSPGDALRVETPGGGGFGRPERG